MHLFEVWAVCGNGVAISFRPRRTYRPYPADTQVLILVEQVINLL